jgi:hypothetical protein
VPESKELPLGDTVQVPPDEDDTLRVYFGSTCVKLAVTVVFPVTTIVVEVEVPEAAPLQPEKV